MASSRCRSRWTTRSRSTTGRARSCPRAARSTCSWSPPRARWGRRSGRASPGAGYGGSSPSGSRRRSRRASWSTTAPCRRGRPAPSRRSTWRRRRTTRSARACARSMTRPSSIGTWITPRSGGSRASRRSPWSTPCSSSHRAGGARSCSARRRAAPFRSWSRASATAAVSPASARIWPARSCPPMTCRSSCSSSPRCAGSRSPPAARRSWSRPACRRSRAPAWRSSTAPASRSPATPPCSSRSAPASTGSAGASSSPTSSTTASPTSAAAAAIDVSASVGSAGRETAHAFLARLVPALGARDAIGAVAFAGRTRVLARPVAGRARLDALVPGGDLDDLEPDETDLAAALARAAALCPDDQQAALLLFTDGNETVGSLLAEAALAEPRVPIYPVVPPPARLPMGTVRRLIAPPLAPAHAALPLEAVVESRAVAPFGAALAVSVNGEALLPVPVELPPGVSAVRLPYRFENAGSYLLEAKLLLAPDAPPAPGAVAAGITVTQPLRVLVVSERAQPVVALALVRRGMDVEVTAPAGLAARVGHLAEYHLVVLEDVARAGIPERALDALARWVAGGGALIATGGAHLFGDGGFAGTALERVLPVELQSQRPEPREREPIALYLLIDRSNSMGYASGPDLPYGAKMEYAKRAALAVVDQLGPRDLVGAIAFDSQPYELGPLLPLAEGRAALTAKIRQLRYGGGTDFKEALDRARRSLVAAGRRVRHVVLLTDGDTNRSAPDHDDLIADLARDDVTVTTIRIGDDTVNLDLLNNISRSTGGAFHHVEDVQALPQLMISDTQHLMDAAANHREAPPRLAAGGAILAGIAEDELPRVSRWAITRPKRGAEVRLWVEAGERQA